MKFILSFLIIFQLSSFCFSQVSTTIENSFKENDWDTALSLIEKDTDIKIRREKINYGFSILPASVSLTSEQLIKVLSLDNQLPYGEARSKLLDHIERIISDTLDPKYPPLLNGLKELKGFSNDVKQSRYIISSFLGERPLLLELQSEFLPEWDSKNQAISSHLTQFHVKRASRSGRQTDADSAFFCLTTLLSDTNLYQGSRMRYEEELLSLSGTVDSAAFNSFLMPYLFSNAGYAQRLTEIMTAKLEQDISSSMNKRGSARLEWVVDFARLKSFLMLIAKQDIPSWTHANKQALLTKVASLWNDRIREIIRMDESNILRIRNRYIQEIKESDLLKPRDAELLVSLAPEGDWGKMVPQLASSIAGSKIQLYAIAKQFTKATTVIKELREAQQPRTTLLFQSEGLLDRMKSTLNPNYASNVNRNDRYQKMNMRSAISMTRLRQKKNIEALKTVLKELDSIGIRPTTKKLLDVYDAIHSQAEVYNYDDLYTIFGDPAKMKEADVFALAEQMLKKLNTEWQQPDIQILANTKRTEKETLKMANKGFETLEKVLSIACDGNSNNGYLVHAFRGAILYQWADFMRKSGIDPKEIAKVQTKGLLAIQDASNRYIDKVPSLYQYDYSIQVYLFWFKAFAEAGIAKQGVKDRPNIKAIREAILKMPPDAAKKHLELLSEAFLEMLPEQKPGERHYYINACMKIIEGTPIASAFQDRLDYYNELLDEAKLIAVASSFDGKVANDMIAFTLYLHYTNELSRESGGFNRYLNNGGSPANMLMIGMGPEISVASREFFEARIHEGVEKQFDIISILFSDPAITAISNDDGWLALPLATVVVRPKDKAIDHIPSIQMDLEFADASETIILPVSSTPIPVKLADPATVPAPSDLVINQKINFVNLDEGRIRLDISASASNVIGCYESIFPNKNFKGLVVSDIEDFGIHPTSSTVDSNMLISHFERNWTLHLKPQDVEKIPSTFTFITPKNAIENKTSYTHDVNFTPCNGSCNISYLKNPETLANHISWNLILYSTGGLLILIIAALYCFFSYKKQPVKEHIIEPKTPFAMHRFLVNIINGRKTLSEDEKAQIRLAITEIETIYFAEKGTQMDEKHLHQLYVRWK